MLRVVTLSTLFPDASRPNFGIFVEQQTRGLAALPDIDMHVIAPVGLPPWPLRRLSRYRSLADLPREDRWRGLAVRRPRFHTVPGTAGRFHAGSLADAILPLVAGIAPDVIDASFFFPDGVAAVAVGRRLGIPVSIKARGADIHHWGRARATASQVRRAGRCADGLLAVSAAMADDMVALGLPRPTVHHTGVDRDRFAPVDRAAAKARLGVDGKLVLSAGALIPRKGHDIVVDAVAALDDVTLAIAGEGPERDRLAARAARHGIGRRVRLLGAVPHEQLATWMAAADAMALASASEGLANVWVEALASGTPLVIPPAGGAAEVVTGDDAGRIVPRDPAAFAAALTDLLANPPTPDAVRRHAERFSWERNAAELRDHLYRIAGRTPD